MRGQWKPNEEINTKKSEMFGLNDEADKYASTVTKFGFGGRLLQTIRTNLELCCFWTERALLDCTETAKQKLF